MYSSNDFWILSNTVLCCRNSSFLPVTVQDLSAAGSSAVAFIRAFQDLSTPWNFLAAAGSCLMMSAEAKIVSRYIQAR